MVSLEFIHKTLTLVICATFMADHDVELQLTWGSRLLAATALFGWLYDNCLAIAVSLCFVLLLLCSAVATCSCV